MYSGSNGLMWINAERTPLLEDSGSLPAHRAPANALNKLLLAVALGLLLLLSTFIGVFASSQHRPDLGKGAPHQTASATTTITTTTTGVTKAHPPTPTGEPKEV